MSGSLIDSVSTQELGNFRDRTNNTIKDLKERIRALEKALQVASISVDTKGE